MSITTPPDSFVHVFLLPLYIPTFQTLELLNGDDCLLKIIVLLASGPSHTTRAFCFILHNIIARSGVSIAAFGIVVEGDLLAVSFAGQKSIENT